MLDGRSTPRWSASSFDRYQLIPTERQLRKFEADVIEEARDWSLDWHSTGGRLTALELLAALQHYGVPTRFLDFTFNPLIALWFAVEKDAESDGRVFAIDISDRIISRTAAASPDPWWFDEDPGSTGIWSTESWIGNLLPSNHGSFGRKAASSWEASHRRTPPETSATRTNGGLSAPPKFEDLCPCLSAC